jgi:hypothetical protein
MFRVPLRATVASIVPRFRFQIPLIRPTRPEHFSEDVLDVSETRIRNNHFEPVEKDGISVFRPEVLSIIDFKPIWKGRKPTKYKRLTRGLTPAGKLIDIQYNSLWLRRDTIVNLLQGIQKSRREDSYEIFRNLRNDYTREVSKVRRTVSKYARFIQLVESAKTSLDIRSIPRSAYGQEFMPINDFFDSRMQIDGDEFETYSDTKILMQLLFDFKSTMEDYSFNLLDLVDSDRINDRSPVIIDRTYTLQDGFTFAINQLRSKNSSINAAQRAFFNSFLNSLPTNPDDRVKLLTTVLSKELRVSKGLGRPENERILRDRFNSGNTGNPFDNIIGVAGKNIFEQPLGPESLLSTLSLPIDENTTVLPFERKYVDSDDDNKTFVPGSTFFIDTVFELDGDQFNTRPFTNYYNEFSRKFIQAKQIIESFFDFENRTSSITPTRMIDSFLNSYRRSITGTTTTDGLNRDQTTIAAIFALANEDNALKSLLFQFCLLVGLALNTPEDRKPVFTNLANELRTIRAFPGVRTSRISNPSLFGGLRTLRPFLSRLANDIENRVFALTTVTPRISRRLTLSTRPDFSRFTRRDDDRTVTLSAFDRLSIRTLRSGQSTVNLQRFNIRNILLSNIDPATTATPNLIKEFVDLANNFNQAAAVNGESVYLLDDRTGRTRFNFISPSTQLLLTFEILASLVSKYNFSKFGKSQTPYNTFITVDTRTNDFVKDTIDDIVSFRPSVTATIASSLLRPAVAYIPLVTTHRATAPSTAPLRRATQTARVTVRRSRRAARRTSRTSQTGGFFSRIRSGTETTLLQQRISSPFLGRSITNRLGIIRITDASFQIRTTNLRRSLISVRSKIIEERKIKQNILNIFETIRKRLRSGHGRFVHGFSRRALGGFLRENSIEDLKITRNPAQVRLSTFLLLDVQNRRVSGITERRSGDRDHIGRTSRDSRGRIVRNITTNLLIDEEVISPDTREALFSLLSESMFLDQSLADIRTKVISVGIPSGFSKQLSDRVAQDSINEQTFKEKQFDVVSISVYKRDARFDDIVFKPQTFLFDLSLFAPTDYRRLRVARNENFDRILQRVQLGDFESMFVEHSSVFPAIRTIANIINDDKYDFLTNDQKREMVRNHTVSRLMEIYVRLLSGLRINESTFLEREIRPGTNFNKSFQDLVFKYLRETLSKEIPNKPVPDLLQDPEVDDESKDILRLFTFGNSIFDPACIRNAVTSPKMFDRVFSIPFNTELFEIDEDLTAETESGQQALNQSFVQERLVRRGDSLFFEPKDRNELAFEDFFVTIENDI